MGIIDYLEALVFGIMIEDTPKKIYRTAYAGIGKRWCKNKALGCAETVNAIVEKATGEPIGGDASTYLMHDVLRRSARFIQVQVPQPGDIIISPTGWGNGRLSNGHVGICGKTHIMSNDYRTGLLEANYTLKTWNDYFYKKGGFPVEIYQVIY